MCVLPACREFSLPGGHEVAKYVQPQQVAEQFVNLQLWQAQHAQAAQQAFGEGCDVEAELHEMLGDAVVLRARHTTAPAAAQPREVVVYITPPHEAPQHTEQCLLSLHHRVLALFARNTHRLLVYQLSPEAVQALVRG